MILVLGVYDGIITRSGALLLCQHRACAPLHIMLLTQVRQCNRTPGGCHRTDSGSGIGVKLCGNGKSFVVV